MVFVNKNMRVRWDLWLLGEIRLIDIESMKDDYVEGEYFVNFMSGVD